MLWFCCDGGLFNKHTDDEETDSIVSLYEDLNIMDLDVDDSRLLQVKLQTLYSYFIFKLELFFLPVMFLSLCF